jgi:hypothetical protein
MNSVGRGRGLLGSLVFEIGCSVKRDANAIFFEFHARIVVGRNDFPISCEEIIFSNSSE